MKKKEKLPNYLIGVNYFNRMFLIVTLCLSISSCEKDDIFRNSEKSILSHSKAVPSEYFNWDNTDYVPTPPGYSKIHVPWYVGATGSITSVYSQDVYSDHKASDGWVLLYSTFSSTTYTQRPYFILYNKYRGLMRIYHYNDNSTLTTSSKVLAGINWEGNGIGNNKVLGYLGNAIININSNNTSHYSVEPSPKNSSELPVSPYKWYMLQYEIAYDPLIIPTTSQTPPTLSWYVNYNNITQFSLGGSLISRAPGKAGSYDLTDSEIDLLSGTTKTFGKVVYEALGNDALNTNPGITSSFYNIYKTSWANILSSISGGSYSMISNFFGAVLGGSSNGTTATMKIDATLKLNGTSTSSGSLFAGTSIYMPGSLAQNRDGSYYVTTGLLPFYNKNLGVFNLLSKPIVPVLNENEYIDYSYPEPTPVKEVTFGWVDNSNKLIFNPEVTKNASVQVVQQDVVIIPIAGSPAYGNNPEIIDGNGTVAFINPSLVSALYYLDYTKAVRFVIKVTPHSTSTPPSYIIKTFLAD